MVIKRDQETNPIKFPILTSSRGMIIYLKKYIEKEVKKYGRWAYVRYHSLGKDKEFNQTEKRNG
jgi:hypothetical protein